MFNDASCSDQVTYETTNKRIYVLYTDFSNSLTLLSSLHLLEPRPHHPTLVDMPHPNVRIA